MTLHCDRSVYDKCNEKKQRQQLCGFIHVSFRVIEWSLRAFASMRAACLFLRARAVVTNFLASSEHFRKYR